MRNYMKSEWYRVVRSKNLVMAIAILGGLVVVMNVVLAAFGHFDSSFRYNTFRFSLNNLTGFSYSIVLLGGVVPGCIFASDRRNGVLKSTVSYGISRDKILIGKFIVSFCSTFLILCAVLALYVGSAWLLLKEREWLPLREMLTGIGAALPSAAASMILMLDLGVMFQKDMTMSIWWTVVFYFAPLAAALLGLRLEPLARIASWTPYGFLRTEAVVTYSNYYCLWDTPEGLAKCILAGVIGIVVFGVFGIWQFRRQEL